MRDPADDGPEVNVISFFRMCPDGAHYLRVRRDAAKLHEAMMLIKLLRSQRIGG